MNVSQLGQHRVTRNVQPILKKIANCVAVKLACGKTDVMQHNELDVGVNRPRIEVWASAPLRCLPPSDRPNRGNRTQAAKLLGITFRSMRYRLERLGMEPDDL